MAHFTYIGGSLGAWATGTTVGSGKWWQLDQNQYKSINGDEGGTWAPSAVIAIGGSYGLSISAPLLVSGLATFTGSVLLGNSILGDTITVMATQSYNGPETHNGSSDWFGSCQFHNALYVSGTFAAQASASLGSSSTDTLAVNAASMFYASASFHANASFVSTTQFNALAIFGASARFSGGIDVQAVSALSEPIVATGNGRVVPTTVFIPDSDYTISTFTSEIYCPSVTVANHFLTLNFNGTNVGDTVYVHVKNAPTYALNVKNSSGGLIIALSNTAVFAAARIVWNGSAWDAYGVKA
jgi:hypothetical protein